MYEIIGYRQAVYTVEDRQYSGWQVSFCIPMSQQVQPGIKCDGVDVFSFFINSSKFPEFEPKLNDCYDLFFSYFNGKRKVSGFVKR